MKTLDRIFFSSWQPHSVPPQSQHRPHPTSRRISASGAAHATALSETDEDFPSTKRDIAVTMAPTDLGGFTLSWSTLQRQKGDPKAPLEVLKSTTVEFVPSVEDNQWRAKAEADPYTGGIIYFARLDCARPHGDELHDREGRQARIPNLPPHGHRQRDEPRVLEREGRQVPAHRQRPTDARQTAVRQRRKFYGDTRTNSAVASSLFFMRA